MRKIWLLAGLLVTSFTAAVQADEGWIELFNGKDLSGWAQRNGTAKYEVKDGTIVGTTNTGSPNSFLCTEETYGDFELEFDVKVDDPLNSGVQIRSKTKDDKPSERVKGPQVEIEAGEAEAGYIYGEATGLGWLTPNDELIPHKHFKSGEWNHYRVVAKGPRIQTWINDAPIADLTHEKIYKDYPSGFLGLQVHGIGKNAGPYSVAWKNIKLKKLDD